MTTRKTTTRKKTAEKPAIVIDEDIEVGMLELPDSKGIRVALIRSARRASPPLNGRRQRDPRRLHQTKIAALGRSGRWKDSSKNTSLKSKRRASS